MATWESLLLCWCFLCEFSTDSWFYFALDCPLTLNILFPVLVFIARSNLATWFNPYLHQPSLATTTKKKCVKHFHTISEALVSVLFSLCVNVQCIFRFRADRNKNIYHRLHQQIWCHSKFSKLSKIKITMWRKNLVIFHLSSKPCNEMITSGSLKVKLQFAP